MRGQGAELPCGGLGNAPTVFRALNSKEAPNKGAGSEASLPVTLRIRRCAPSCSTSYLHIVASNGRGHAADLADIAALSRKQEISPLRRRPKGNENRRSLRSPFGNLRSAHPCFLTSIGTFSVHAAAFPPKPPNSPSNFPFPGIFLPPSFVSYAGRTFPALIHPGEKEHHPHAALLESLADLSADFRPCRHRLPR